MTCFRDQTSSNCQRLDGRSSAVLSSSGWKGMTHPKASIDWVVADSNWGNTNQTTSLGEFSNATYMGFFSLGVHTFFCTTTLCTCLRIFGWQRPFKIKYWKDTNFSISQMNRCFACLWTHTQLITYEDLSRFRCYCLFSGSFARRYANVHFIH